MGLVENLIYDGFLVSVYFLTLMGLVENLICDGFLVSVYFLTLMGLVENLICDVFFGISIFSHVNGAGRKLDM